MPTLKECKMPKIDLDYKAVSRYWGARMVGTDIGYPSEMYRAVFIRLADKALYEYIMARNAVLAQIERKDISHPLTTFIAGKPFYYIVIGNHLETCVNATKRALDILKRMKCDNRVPFFIDRTFRKEVERFFEEVKEMRNILEHIDEEISKGTIKKGQAYLPAINEDATEVEIGDQKLDLISLAKVISKLHEFALELASYEAPGAEKWLFPKFIHPKENDETRN
jgi:hypothetical protein